jgi:hypothetical protein
MGQSETLSFFLGKNTFKIFFGETKISASIFPLFHIAPLSPMNIKLWVNPLLCCFGVTGGATIWFFRWIIIRHTKVPIIPSFYNAKVPRYSGGNI